MTNIIQNAGAVAVGSSAVLDHIVYLVNGLYIMLIADHLALAALLAWNVIGGRRDTNRAKL